MDNDTKTIPESHDTSVENLLALSLNELVGIGQRYDEDTDSITQVPSTAVETIALEQSPVAITQPKNKFHVSAIRDAYYMFLNLKNKENFDSEIIEPSMNWLREITFYGSDKTTASRNNRFKHMTSLVENFQAIGIDPYLAIDIMVMMTAQRNYIRKMRQFHSKSLTPNLADPNNQEQSKKTIYYFWNSNLIGRRPQESDHSGGLIKVPGCLVLAEITNRMNFNIVQELSNTYKDCKPEDILRIRDLLMNISFLKTNSFKCNKTHSTITNARLSVLQKLSPASLDIDGAEESFKDLQKTNPELFAYDVNE